MIWLQDATVPWHRREAVNQSWFCLLRLGVSDIARVVMEQWGDAVLYCGLRSEGIVHEALRRNQHMNVRRLLVEYGTVQRVPKQCRVRTDENPFIRRANADPGKIPEATSC